MIQQKALSKPPTAFRNDQYESAVAAGKAPQREDLPDFKAVMAESAVVRAKEMEEQRAEKGADGFFNVAETKSDQDFRNQLEKVTGKPQGKPKNKLERDDYLNLMVTQLKYQDPLKPMENQEMAQQMAQMNTVEQLISVNKTLENMSKAQNESRIDRLTPYLDKAIIVNGSQLKIADDKSISKGRFELPSEANSVAINIKDSQNNVVRTISFDKLNAGEHGVEWDGKDQTGKILPAGNYKFELNATTSDGKPIKAKTMYETVVTGVTDVANGGKLMTSSGPVELGDITTLRNNTKAAAQNAIQATATPPAVATGTATATTAQAGAPAGLQDAMQSAMKSMTQNINQNSLPAPTHTSSKNEGGIVSNTEQKSVAPAKNNVTELAQNTVNNKQQQAL